VASLFESVPNFSEGRRKEVIDAIANASSAAHLLDCDPDADHNRVVVSIAGGRDAVADRLMASIAEAVERIDVRSHLGVHPRVGAADVVPIVPLADTTLSECREMAHELGHRVWRELGVPVYFYGQGEGRSLADIRAGRAKPDVGGPALHTTAGAVCVGARLTLVAFNVLLPDADIVTARALARSLRESADGMRGVQALIFELPGGSVQLSMNLFRIDETTPARVMSELERRGVPLGAQQLVGLCPAVVANAAASGRMLEARLASAASSAAATTCRELADDEHVALAGKLEREAASLAQLDVDQDSVLAGAERAAALVEVLRAGRVLDGELEAMLRIAAHGLRAAITQATGALYRTRVDALDRRLAEP
jgi:glutamate formiminotransferase / 5-formyltetrahydrofolate cyclo-ligase